MLGGRQAPPIRTSNHPEAGWWNSRLHRLRVPFEGDAFFNFGGPVKQAAARGGVVALAGHTCVAVDGQRVERWPAILFAPLRDLSEKRCSLFSGVQNAIGGPAHPLLPCPRLARWERSGLTLTEFGRRRGMAPSSLAATACWLLGSLSSTLTIL